MTQATAENTSKPFWHVRRALTLLVVVLALLIGLPALALSYEEGFWFRRALYWVSPDDRQPSLVDMCAIRPGYDGPELAHALVSDKPMLQITAAWILLGRGDVRALDVFVDSYARYGHTHIKIDFQAAIARAFNDTIPVPEPDGARDWWRERRGRVNYLGDGRFVIRG